MQEKRRGIGFRKKTGEPQWYPLSNYTVTATRADSRLISFTVSALQDTSEGEQGQIQSPHSPLARLKVKASVQVECKLHEKKVTRTAMI